MNINANKDYIAYQNTISLVYLKAVRDVLGDIAIEIDNSLNKGFFTVPANKEEITEEQVKAIDKRMGEIIKEDMPISKKTYTKEEALRLCDKNGLAVKRRIIEKYPDDEMVEFCTLDGYSNYFYGDMAKSTGAVSIYEVRKYGDGILLRFPYHTQLDRLPEYVDDKKIHEAFVEAKRWQKLLDIIYMPDLNEKVLAGEAKGLILLSEALHEKKIAEMADMITKGKKRIVLIAGPSSSGKTTTAKRLSVQLRVNGLNPLYLGTDDYFVERSQTPVDENGNPDYEGLDALDIELFNSNMNDLLAGKEVDLPEFDFVTGRKIFGKRITSIREDQPIVIEGIHALNGKLTEFIDDDEKFRIYISPFTQLNIDMHNRVPTTDARMLRRMVRDFKYRNRPAAGTIAQWHQVRAGEDKNIFPFNGEADVVFNTVLVYELAILKKYAEPLLQEIGADEPGYDEAQRLLNFIQPFEIIEDESAIPNNSILREFIGGSVFVE